MSLPMLFGGAECGPSNPLQGLSKRFDQDRGIQQDHFGAASRAGSSRDAFRTQTSNARPDADATKFFSSPSASMMMMPGMTAFDVSALRSALPPPSVQTPQLQSPMATAGWAADFMNMSLGDLGSPKQEQEQEQVANAGAQIAQAAGVPQQQNVGMFSPPPLIQNWMMPVNMHSFALQTPIQQQTPRFNDQITWDKEFSAQEINLTNAVSSLPAEQHTQEQESSQRQSNFEADELARTAGMLLEHLKHESNPKFKQSQFLGLMKQLRDGEVVVEGNNMVENDSQMRNSSQINGSSAVDVKGKGKERAIMSSTTTTMPMNYVGPPADYHEMVARGFLPVQAAESPSLQQQNQQTEGEQAAEEDPNLAYFMQENEDYINYWTRVNERTAAAQSTQEREWDTLQDDWDKFEATATGIRRIDNYQFQESNPYLVGDPSRTRNHVGSTIFESVLELEAAVQRDLNNAQAWYELGVRQQENEREHKALQALQRAVELDPTHLPSWLALAISFTNDNNRIGTYDAIEEWVRRNEKYADATDGGGLRLDPSGSNTGVTTGERYTKLVDRLIAMVRSASANGEIDADVQIALAVLLNSNEEYEKAQDCFSTALAVRPDDWLLYNRVGATMANNGRAEEALEYYYKALELNPGYIRARFNLGISCINLRRYEEAAQHILDALMLQDNDVVRDANGHNETRGVTSAALWDSLKTTCLQMQRSDLATLCDMRDVEAFRLRFQEGNME